MNECQSESLLSEVADYYGYKLAQHGATPHGVDWNGEESQIVRFQQLCKVFEKNQQPISINDLGCGYGSLLEYLQNRANISSYLGIDVSEEMIIAAEKIHFGKANTRFITSSRPDKIADYCIASGIFNVRLGRTDNEWLAYLKATLDVLNATSTCGFAFNCLTSYSDEDKKRDYLYYANPCFIFDYCKIRYSRQIALLHDYDLYEFTILVRKST